MLTSACSHTGVLILAAAASLLCYIILLAEACSELAYKDDRKYTQAGTGCSSNLSIDTRDDDDDLLEASFASKLVGELPELTSSSNQDSELLLEATKTVLHDIDELNGRHTMSEVCLMAAVSLPQGMVYSSIFTHKYDNYADMRLAAGPSVDNDRCLDQLESLVARARLQAKEKYSSVDVNFYQLMDTWAHVPSGLLLGNTNMQGMYSECLRLKIELPNGQQAPTRYCSMSIKHASWPAKVDKHDVASTKAGICIPKTCDSTIYKNKIDLLMTLLEHQMRPLEQGQAKFDGNLYCLPDEDSPLRSVWKSPLARTTLIGLIGWLLLLVYYTYMHNKLSARLSVSTGDKTFGLTNVSADKTDGVAANGQHLPDETDTLANRAQEQQRHADNMLKIYMMFSITNNFKLLFSSNKASSLLESAKKLEHQEDTKSFQQVDENNNNGNNHAASLHSQSKIDHTKMKIVDLSCIEGIKVIAMAYIILGHVIMCLPTIITNGREMSVKTSFAFFVANLMPAFAVNAFFTITGALTCYMLFKQNQSHQFITSPGKWVAFIAYRYLRIMPMYALAVLYCKTLAKYTGSGPLWDYGTSSLGQRRACEQEPWDWTLLFKSNYVPPLKHCIPGGWYLSNDFQFFLVTPFFLALLYKRPRLGQAMLYLCTLAGYLAGFWSVYGANLSDLRPIAMFDPHGFKTYVSHLSNSYTHPLNRIPAYLIGLLIGYQLYLFERGKLDSLDAARNKPQQHSVQDNSTCSSFKLTARREPDWSSGFKSFGPRLCLLLLSICFLSPAIGPMLPLNKWSAHLLIAFVMPTFHIMFALAVGLYLLLATTGHGNKLLNRFLSANIWKPLARLSLCALLVNVEVINYLIQSNTSMQYYSNQYHSAMNCLCILAVYAVSIVVCVLFEAPIRAALNSLVSYSIKQISAQVKRAKTLKTN